MCQRKRVSFISDQTIHDFAQNLERYEEFIHPYLEAKTKVEYQLTHLDKEFQKKYQHKVIHGIQSRMKSLESIEKKLRKKDREISLESAKESLTDIGGIRVVCSYKKDIYTIVETIQKRWDFILLKEKDYIEHPKPNGYSSYHLILGVEAFDMDGCKSYYPVEVQLRTMAMDFWASLEHQLCYKEEGIRDEEFSGELKSFSEILDGIELRMEEFSKRKEGDTYE